MLFFHLCSDLSRTEIDSRPVWEQYRPSFCTSCLCQAKSEGMKVSHGFELEIPAWQISVIYSTRRPHPTAFLTKHKGKKKKTQKTNPVPSSHSHATRTCFFLQITEKYGRLGKADGILWNRNNQSRTSFPPLPTSPPVATQICPLI